MGSTARRAWRPYVGCWDRATTRLGQESIHESPTCPYPPLPHMQAHYSLGSIACQAVCQVQHSRPPRAVAEHLVEAPLGHLHKHIAPQRLSLQGGRTMGKQAVGKAGGGAFQNMDQKAHLALGGPCPSRLASHLPDLAPQQPWVAQRRVCSVQHCADVGGGGGGLHSR